MNHCLFKAKDTKGAVGNTVDYSSLTFPVLSAQKYCLKQKFLNRDLDRVTASTGLKKKERRNLLNLM